ncbi:hypothetical protein LUZ60_009192 [Juncus effusus]|nr:hypothetical protein LUZ60_009187 [Juncus effusus]KAJ3693712.1 hypothetical protein LUZ60_009192 [Juncus effusus]
MALLFESPNHNIKPPMGPRHCRIRSLSIQSNLSDFDKEKPRKQLSLSDFNNENPKQHIKGPSDFSKESNPKNQSNKKLNSFRNLLDAHRTFTKSLSTPCFTQFVGHTLNSSKKDNGPSIQLISTNKPQGINELIAEATNVIKLGLHPIENQGERSQVFMLKNQSNEPVAVFKMMDCTATAAREVAAYVLDHNGFSGVTPSAIVKISHLDLNKTKAVSASLQRFIPHCCDGRAMGPSQFLVGPVHRIGILDIRVLNIDRHTGNILVKKKTNASDTIADEVYDLMPIDHELCLPEELEDPYFEWQSWRQASVPFSDYEKEYVASLDPFKDADLLRSELPQIKEAAIFCA